MKYCLGLFGFILAWSSLAQSDTLYIRFKNVESNRVFAGFRHKNDTSDIYPFDGGRIYIFGKMRKGHGRISNFTFSFRSTSFKKSSQQFYYQELDQSQLEEMLKQKDFKDREWFNKTSYIDIIKYFGRKKSGDRIIMLLDETQMSGDKIYLVRVYFSFDAEE